MSNQRNAAPLSVEPSSREQFSISDMARTYGVSLRTLRFYEDRGLLSPQRHGTARFYNAANRVRLELILKGKRLGFTLAEIQDLITSHFKQNHASHGVDGGADIMVGLNHDQIQAQITHLERQRDDLDVALSELRQALTRLQASHS